MIEEVRLCLKQKRHLFFQFREMIDHNAPNNIQPQAIIPMDQIIASIHYFSRSCYMYPYPYINCLVASNSFLK